MAIKIGLVIFIHFFKGHCDISRIDPYVLKNHNKSLSKLGKIFLLEKPFFAQCSFGLILIKPNVCHISKIYLTTNDPYQKRNQKKF